MLKRWGWGKREKKKEKKEGGKEERGECVAFLKEKDLLKAKFNVFGTVACGINKTQFSMALESMGLARAGLNGQVWSELGSW